MNIVYAVLIIQEIGKSLYSETVDSIHASIESANETAQTLQEQLPLGFSTDIESFQVENSEPEEEGLNDF